MNLTQGQKTSLKSHILLNTNSCVVAQDGSTAQINTCPGAVANDPTWQLAIADWYNGTALVADIGAPVNLNLWNPFTTITQINTAVDWSLNPVGAVDALVTNSWLKWQSMCWHNVLDFTDPQVRLGIISVWGTGSNNTNSLGSLQAGKVVGRRIDHVLSGAVVSTAGMNGGAKVVAKGFNKEVLFGVLLTQTDVANALTVG